MDPEKRLLDHPFYEAWERGDVTTEQLSQYATAYQEFMDRVPTYWEQVLDGLAVEEPAGEVIVTEERRHAELWSEWRAELPAPGAEPTLDDLFEGLDGMTTSELAGAIHAYECQQPEVAATKKAGLVEHYGFSENLDFFEEHEDEAEHVAFGEQIREEYADQEAFDRGFRRGAELVYHSLDGFAN